MINKFKNGTNKNGIQISKIAINFKKVIIEILITLEVVTSESMFML